MDITVLNDRKTRLSIFILKTYYVDIGGEKKAFLYIE